MNGDISVIIVCMSAGRDKSTLKFKMKLEIRSTLKPEITFKLS